VNTPAMKDLSEFDQSWNFFARHYEAKFKGSQKPKIHLTSAVDTECCKKVWLSIIQVFQSTNLGRAGLL